MKNIIIILFAVFSSLAYYSCSEDNPASAFNRPPNAPCNPIPHDGQENVYRFVTLSWSCTDPDPGDSLIFDVIASCPPEYEWQSVVSDYPLMTYFWGLAPDSVKIYWQVTAKDNHRHGTQGPVWSFTTGHD